MAHSIQVFDGKSEIINDLDLMVIIGFALPIMHESERFASLANLAADWQEALALYGPGVIDLKLERILENPKIGPELTTVLDLVRDRIDQYGEAIPAKVLNAEVRVSGVIFYDYNVPLLRAALKRLRTLITKL